MKKPDFLVVGTMKSGTNTLGRYLEKHPQVFMYPKEIQFFSNEEKYAKGEDWYLQLFQEREEGQIAGERSPVYCSTPHAVKRIKDLLPDAKFVWIFRNPTLRAYSQYWHFAVRGGEKNEFAKAVELEEQWAEDKKMYGYLYRSRYAEQVKRWLEVFSREQMLFLTTEELKANPKPVINGMFEFLGIDQLGEIAQEKIVSHKTYVPKNLAVHYHGIKTLENVSPRALHYFKKFSTRPKPGYPPLEKDTFEKLSEYFPPYNEQLGELTGLDVSVWNK